LVLISLPHIYSGDDCVSIQTGCSNVHMKNVVCNPGHGIRCLCNLTQEFSLMFLPWNNVCPAV
jgi:hypothetical protein